MRRMTKVELIQLNESLSAQNHELRKKVGDLTLKLALPPVNIVYPLKDKLGRNYRLDKGVRCYPAEH